MKLVPLALALALWGCSGPSTVPETPEPAAAASDKPNVVLVTLDTTRADRIGAYGYDKAMTPTLDALAARGRRYEHAYSPIPFTIPAHAALFTGKTPATLGIRANGNALLKYENNTLAESFKAGGYQTVAVVGAFVTNHQWGFDQGFDTYLDHIDQQRNFWATERRADAVVDELLAWKKDQDGGKPIFAWVHLFDPHFPYQAPKEWQEKMPERPYDAELAWTDSQLARVIEAFDPEKTVFVVLADHGESLGDHDEGTHGMFLYDSTQRVPLIIAGPGVETAVVDEPTGLVDVAPTLLDLVGLPPLPDIEGRIAPGDPVKPIYMESYQLSQRFGLAPHVAVVDGADKLIDLPRPELYAITDVMDAENLAESRADEVTRLKGVLKGLGKAPPGEEEVHMDASVAAQLQALGYTDGTMTFDADAVLPDPKDHTEMVLAAQHLDRLFLTNQLAEAEKSLAELVKKYPDVLEFQNRYAKALAAQGRNEEALAAVRKARVRDPDAPTLKQSEAFILAELEQWDEAVTLLLDVAQETPYSPRIRAAAFTALVRSGKFNEAVQLGVAYSKEYPEDYALAGAMGVEMVKHGKLQAGLELLQIGANATMPERDVHYQIAALFTGKGETDKALHHLEKELEHWPRNHAARVTYVRLLGARPDAEKLRVEAEKLRAAQPELAEAHYWVAQALFNLKRYDESLEAVQAGYARDPKHPELLIMHANILAKQGKKDEGAKLVEQAKLEHQAREKAKVPAPR